MKKSLLFLPFLLLLVGAFISCEEVEEAGKYDNWRERGEAFVDSIKRLTGENYVATAEQADAMELGKLYAIQTTASTSEGAQYVYCKKLVKNETGERPLYTGYHSKVNAYYYGTYVNGEEFDGCFDGYSAIDRDIPIPPVKEPTVLIHSWILKFRMSLPVGQLPCSLCGWVSGGCCISLIKADMV